MADVKMSESIPCKFDAKGWAPCKKPSTNGLCSKHESLKCRSCGEQALRNCDCGMGGLSCGAPLCGTCQHSLEDYGHVVKSVYLVQVAEREEFERTNKESKRMLSRRGVPTDVELPSSLAELLDTQRNDFNLVMCYLIRIKHGLMGEFPVVLAENEHVVIISPDKGSMVRIWRTLPPKNSEMLMDVWMVNLEIGVGYRMSSNKTEQSRIYPCRVFLREEIEKLFAKEEQPFRWADGLLGGQLSKEQFEHLIQQEVT